MRTLIPLALTLPLILAIPVQGQDFLGPLEDLVDQITAPATPQRPPAAVPKPQVDAPVVAPIPRPRPPDLPNAPTPNPPTVPAPETELSSPDTAPEADTEQAEIAQDERVYQAACPAVIKGLVEAEMAPPLSDGICGERSPLTVTAVLSRGRMVPLSSPVTTNCNMATALPDWVETVDGYAETMLESPLAQIDVGTSYMCRARNNASEGFTSEHGFANALDIVGFTLEDSSSIGVTEDWAAAEEPTGRLLRLAHDAACGSFMTVLGPEANAEHEDHLHLDLGCHGAACTARICE